MGHAPIKDEQMPPGMVSSKALTESIMRMMTNDTFSNMLARTGYGTPNIMEGTNYPLTRISNDYNLINSLYRNHWIIRKVIDTIPEDMTRNWIKLQSSIPPDKLKKVDKIFRTRRIKQKILHGLKWGRLYGGAAGVIMIDGHEDMLDQPLDYDDILPGTFKNIWVVDRWVGAYPSGEMVDDINDVEFGLPKYYEVTLEDHTVTRIHHSRVIRFVGRELPYWEKLAEVYWGESEVEIVYEELKKRDNTSWNIAQLIFLANIRVLKIEDFAELLATGDQQQQQDVYNVIQAQNWLMSNQGVQVLGAKDTFETHQYSFAGLNDIYQSFMLDISGATQIPVTRLFGRSPAGMDATGDADMDNYYDVVKQGQESFLMPVLDKILPIMFVSELGEIPSDWDYKFNPIKTPDEKDVADLVEQKSTAVINAMNAGIISQKVALTELKNLSDTTDMFNSITDEMIEKASESLDEGEAIPDEAFGSLMGTKTSNRTGIPQRNSTGDSKVGWFDRWIRRTRRNH